MKNYLSAHPLAQGELSVVLLSFLSGGLATTRNTLLWCFTILAAQLELQNTAYEAIRQLYPDDKQIFGSEVVEVEEVQYIRALLRECLRGYTPVRLSLPRLTIQEFEYEGKGVPPETMILLNAWACNIDPLVYEDPEIFRPERWLENPDLPLFAFGLGYRVCPGYHLANRDIYVVLVRTIAAFEIKAIHRTDADPLTGCADPRSHRFYFVPRDLNCLKEVLGGC
ncbi:hypothetical protein ASPVEDRAFT_33002 [Aspergillus versicolor CBS 583.65]|uniref:Cytochrome P450 n=1 Tax=Aspergillus versicolor CBS 583.65 TaxID=1036611 RepID=A0A1L9PZ61_ASPVE|nr:uncharacterized protein ASPVEDRAFT_33002 [Aspergillus versicolor CBS 583.65]OJJ06726.1 hypothetical protein ASPVEDRAFT_33002 [Aspergillus versicolor CBS 583.65]